MSRTITIQTKKRILQAIVESILTYGAECLVRYPCLNFYLANRCTIDFDRLLSRGYLLCGYLAVIHLCSDSYYYPGGSEYIVDL